VFAFIDESGHTGSNIDDEKQQTFNTLAIFSKRNLDIQHKSRIHKLCAELSVRELHGVELGDRLEYVAAILLPLLQSSSPDFFLCSVDKDYLSITKLFDTVFDPYENLGARNHTYQIRFLRLLLLGKLCYITEKSTAFRFYKDCLFAKSKIQANDVLVECCTSIIKNVEILPDTRSIELISDALNWAIQNPNKLTTYKTRKQSRWMHLPNIVSFLPMLDILAKAAKKNRTQVHQIIHDEQLQVASNLKEIHKVASTNKTCDVVNLFDNGYLLLKTLKSSNFQMKQSIDSPGLQIVDVCLYLYGRREYIKQNVHEIPNSMNLLLYIAKHGKSFNFSLDSLQAECIQAYRQVMALDLKDTDLLKGKKILEEAETKWKQRLASGINESDKEEKA